MQKAQKQHPSLRSRLSPSGDGSLQGKKNKETTSWSLRHSQSKLVEMFQPGNKSCQAIKCFTQTPSLTPPWAPCTISHTAGFATYKIETSDHKHKKELCFAAMHFQHSNGPVPQGGTGFVPVSFRKRFQRANYPHYTHGRSGCYTSKGAQGTIHRGRSSGRSFHSPVADPCQGWVTLLSSCAYSVPQTSGGFGCWGTPSMLALDFLIALLPTKTRSASQDVRGSLAKSS